MSKIDIAELLKILLKLILENNTVKRAIISALSGVVATHDDIVKLTEAMDKLFEQMDNRFKKLIDLMNTGFTEARKERDSLRVAIYSINSRGGEKLENLILNMLSDKLLQQNIERSNIAHQVLIDRQGDVYFENYSTDVDIVIQDGKTFLMEVKSTADNRDIFDLQKKRELYNNLAEKNYDGLILACLEINRANFELAIKQDVHVIAGAINF
jgi:hypothetical protein